MAEKSIIIIGAGIAGLTAGIYAQINGYKTTIFEMHSKPGGLCTAWKRNSYTIDGCLHWLVGSSPDSSYNHMWQEMGVLQGKQIINMDQFLRIELKEGQVLTLYTDVDRLEKHLKEFAPEDTLFIEEFTGAIRHFGNFEMPVGKAMEISSHLDNARMLSSMIPFLGELQKWGKITMKDFALRFKNPLLREAWQIMWSPDFSAFALLITLSWMNQKNAGYIIGGSTEISRSMEKRYLDLGGQISYRSRVKKILVENNRAAGIELADGTMHRASHVISAADGHSTIFKMLEGKYLDDTIRGYYEKMPIFQPLVYIGLGVNRSFDDVPKTISGIILSLVTPLTFGGKEYKQMGVHIYNFDPTFAPQGKTVLSVMFDSEFAYWDNLRKDLSSYNAEKERITDTVIKVLDKRFPGLASQVEMRNVATPITFRRYTGNWQGSFEGWLPTPNTMSLRMKKTLPGLANFYMAGQWVSPGGGLPGGLITGFHVIQIICKVDKKKHVQSIA